MIRVKICGITSPEDAAYAARAGADAIGLVFAPSPRRVSLAQAEEIVRAAPPFLAVVGLFVDESPETVVQIARLLSLTAVQLHGDESVQTVAHVARHCRVIKAFRVRRAEDVLASEAYAKHASGYLFDAYVPGRAGGTGQAFNWSFLPPAGADPLSRPWLIAGGLRPDNVHDALEGRAPYGVDVSSGVEREPGKKDEALVREFVQKVRRVAHG